ncbi:uncharacterized protein LOC116337053 isoform X2 [Contarinia nasturtii]|uniref:uncharacterized protein LOC116337053 isoform X2 n=1 Tax=Contarinia nasturtii TaxID=265458 RepID=UPI0012D497A7|nr:uncharacterized protein LOC116337053 isoform X2 [Contarinia nasturtii]
MYISNMKLLVSMICAIFMASKIAAQGFPPQFLSQQQQQQQQQTPLLVSGGTRRQLTPAQQNHILTDIQQHQRFATQNHLFNPNQQQKVFGQKIAQNVLIEPSLQSQLPTETTVFQIQAAQNPQFSFLNPQVPQQQALQGRFRSQNNVRTNELHAQHHTQTSFVPNFNGAPQNNVVFPQQPLFERNPQQVFQRSVANQQGDANVVFRPSQPFPVIPPAPVIPTQANPEPTFSGQSLQPVQTLQQNQLHHQPNVHQPNVHQANLHQTNVHQVNGHQPNLHQVNAHQPNLHQINAHQQNVQNVQFVQNPVLSSVQTQQFNQFQNQPVHFNQPAATNNAPFFGDIRPEDPRYKEFVERQKIIQKHEHFVQRNYEKQLAKARQQHQDFVQQQRRIKEQSIVNMKQRPSNNFFPPITRGRLVSPYEIGQFERAVQNYQKQFPTTTKATTTPSPITESVAAAASSTTTRVKASRSNVKGDISEDELERLLLQHRDKLYTQLKQADDKTTKKSRTKPTKPSGDLLKQLKLALADQPADLGNSNYTTMDLVLPDGQKVQVIRTTDPNLVKGATPLNADGTILAEQPSGQAQTIDQKPLIEDAADSGLIPPGSDFEVIRQSTDGSLQPVDNLPQKKKVTFVYLEEQNDGSYKVQGVKANGEKEAHTKGAEVDSIINRIKNGEIQLPPANVRRNTLSPSTPIQSSSPASTSYVSNTIYDSSSPSTHFMTSATPSPTFSFVSSVSPYSTLSTDPTEDQENLLTASPSSHYPTSTPRTVSSRSIYTTRSLSTTYSDNHIASTGQQQQSISPNTVTAQAQTPTTSPPETNTQSSELINILKNNGLHAMAKYLKQSGLDSILNETGPYTLFAPSDKAFKNLLVQLGGPDRAEEKFKSNPRLLSGLLLHHVIPGYFEISALQDEMTGVSLAGTQLRVNQYNMHDTEWNDVKITTINGAMVLPEKKDIIIPQGVAHSVDRVMFPLPVGDILQTLQSDRERRFTNFLRALFSSGLTELLQNKDPNSGRTYTVFAPTDLAFSNHTQEEINLMVTDKATAHKLVMRHVTPGTLFSSGMRFYQVRDSLQAGNAITLQKVNNGKIKVNESQMVSSNIPATNGVIHVIDSLL